MTYKETDSGNVNSNYLKSSGYRENCQSCVVTYEAKLRGYDVEVLPNTKGSVLEKLSRNTNLAWIDPKTNINPEYIFTTPKKLYKFIDEIVKQNERYTFQWFWKYKWKRGGHIVIIYKNNILTLYDPQSNEIYEGFDMFKQYETLKFAVLNDELFLGKEFTTPKLLRVDNLEFNLGVVNKIMKGKKK